MFSTYAELQEYSMRLLIVEDHKKIAGFLKRGLEEEHYAVDIAHTGEDALALIEVTPYDLVILDLMLPEMDGLEVCRRLRARGENIPILMLTAKYRVEDRVMGLDLGADDYLTKPFAFPELLARVRSALRRHGQTKTVTLQVADLVLNTATHEVTRAGRPIALVNKEYAVLEYLMRRAGQVVTRSMILEAVWNYEFDPESNVIDVYVRYLRRKLDDPCPVKLIETIRGTGYRLRAPRVS
jgi:DNA-binding response OmpR family regulator